MHRLLVESALLAEERPVLPADAAKHLKIVRPKDGEEIELFDGKGKWRRFRVQGFGANGKNRLIPTSSTFDLRPSTFHLTLFACVTKGSRWDWTVEKATELGVTRIVPVISDRTIVRIAKSERAAKRERWQRIAEDAARQSDAKWLPEIAEAVDFADALPLVRETTCFIGALTTPPARPLLEAVGEKVEGGRSKAGQWNFSTFIGPEGDFTPEELAALMEIATPTSFGPTVLRAETAAIYAVSVIQAQMNSEREGRDGEE